MSENSEKSDESKKEIVEIPCKGPKVAFEGEDSSSVSEIPCEDESSIFSTYSFIKPYNKDGTPRYLFQMPYDETPSSSHGMSLRGDDDPYEIPRGEEDPINQKRQTNFPIPMPSEHVEPNGEEESSGESRPLHEILKENYYFIPPGAPNPRTILIEGLTRKDQVEHMATQEALWLGSLNVKLPENGMNHKVLPDIDKRKPFHVAARNYPIPEPPIIPRFHPRPLEGRNVLRKPSEYTRKPTKEEIERDETEKDRNAYVKNLRDLQKATKMAYREVQSLTRELEAVYQELKKSEEYTERWKRKSAFQEKRRSEHLKEREAIFQAQEDFEGKPTQMREENRELRYKLYHLEPMMVKSKEEYRKVRDVEEEGPRFLEMQKLQSDHDKLDKQILDLAKLREERQNLLKKVWTGVTDQVAKIGSTKEDLFGKPTDEKYQVPCDLNNNNEVSEQPALLAIEKARIRRVQIKKHLTDLKNNLGESFKFESLLPPSSHHPDPSDDQPNENTHMHFYDETEI